ncbi:MAG: NAD(P)/FAD-dependent oxidoreductase [Rhodospirillaceae bacterium]|jgi:NADPH-dependent 2,4-dienoyl-CoA reductase/sulfur reductase-like enzyme|nr:NAD(P)/FAD-dependent oxidoreductase [Rhodospirillaceae bacterium]MBT5244263.1 NAD(P)/FAD-dependent oxidoreductase [Rhodospirillaceae bacterium]MBT5561788.1 NAD(P)/FAD-dependent oxidoreductase [Rhodospirillaceae bacterium]MBT6243227.1 NAD(P)/FAD-dependent oxidoreductase [Rhodospirillaceae bacterium]
MQYVIVGAGPSGVTAAETLRSADPDATVVLVDGEKDPPYGRMAIPYFLTGKVSEEGVYLRKAENHFENLGIKYIQARAKSVSHDDNTLTLDSGETVAFDKMLVATGSHPIKPPIKGLDRPNIHHCWTLEDARNIVGIAGQGVDVVLMGAGFIGCIIMEALALSGANLTVVEAEDRMVPRMMDQNAGNMIKDWCIEKGVNVLTSARVDSVGEAAGKLAVHVNNGDVINADLVVVATGVRPNADFLDGSGVEIDAGIKVDNHLKSSVDNIYAAGDVAQGPDFSTGDWSVHAVQPTGVEHGRIAAMNMAGKQIDYRGSLNMNVLDTLGLISCSFGLWQGAEGGDSATMLDQENYRYTLLNFDGDLLVGALMIGRTDGIGVIRGLIQTRVNLASWKERLMTDPNRFIEAYIDCTRGEGS